MAMLCVDCALLWATLLSQPHFLFVALAGGKRSLGRADGVISKPA
jgi:hypothetical protein